MREIHRSALVSYPAEDMFALVNDVDSYPRFLTWCRSATAVATADNELQASLEFAKSGLHRRFTTRNRFEPGRAIRMDLVSGPFRVLSGNWEFRPLGAGGSKVSLDLRFEFASRLLEAVFAPVFGEVMNSLVDAFVERANELHERP
ncbi:MAG TPA: type II toxin-antitoxin system RatA family toxin [Gammaproteobacteria bacterium]|nr:type II toxin-antitoxin system RatA family toxin [Gammaproteobacteria bacterium]